MLRNKPRIVIAMTASTKTSTGIVRNVPHNTEPTAELRAIAYGIAETFLEVIGKAAASVRLLEFDFVRGCNPGELELHCRLEVVASNNMPIVIKQKAPYFSDEHMRTPEKLQQRLITPLRSQLAIELAKQRSERERETEAATAAINLLLIYVGKPVRAADLCF